MTYLKYLWNPRSWPVSIMMTLLWCIAWLPYRMQGYLGQGMGYLAYRLCKRRRHITATNIALCFPESDAQQQTALVKACFADSGRGLLEAAQGWWLPRWRLQNYSLRINGQQYLEQARQQGKGVILLSAHFSCMEIAGRLLSEHLAMCVMYRPHKNPLFEAIMQRSRNKYFKKAIARHDLRCIYKALRANDIVWYAADQDYGAKHSVFVPFFNIATAMVTTVSRIARSTGAQVVPLFYHRSEDGSYGVDIYPALQNFPAQSYEQDAASIAKLLENEIKQYPEQYYWLHRRFKTRPPGDASFYS